MAYEARMVDPKGDVYVVGSPSERARLVARGYRDENPEKVSPVEATPVNDGEKTEPKAADAGEQNKPEAVGRRKP